MTSSVIFISYRERFFKHYHHNLGNSSFFFVKFQFCILCSYFNLRRASTYAYYYIGIKHSDFLHGVHPCFLDISVKRSNCLLSAVFLLFSYLDLFKSISTMTIKRSLIFVLDICHLFWDTGYLSKNYFGIFEKNNSGIRDIRGRLLWDIGYPPKQASEVTD